MTEPKKPVTAAESAKPPAQAANAAAVAGVPASQNLTPEQARLQRLREKGGRVLDDDPQAWSRAAARIKSMDKAKFVAEALEWKEKRGKFPWEEPPTKTQADQSQWLRNWGIDPDKIRDDSRREMEELIRKHQAQKKTDGRGR